mgnify:CR=1 FL=1
MRKKRSGGGGANWMDTYGDMVTLLLCFFVMLYSMSSVDKEKWQSLVQSFNPDATIEEDVEPYGGTTDTQQDADQVEADIETLYQAMTDYVQQEQLSDQISVTKGSGYVFVSFDNTVFFDGDSYVLRPEGKTILDQVAGSIAQVSDSIEEIRVLGHTAQEDPNQPNNPRSDRFLASNRAAEVTVYLQEKNIVDPTRIVSVGYGQWRPVAGNDTADGRAQNRRVELLVAGLNAADNIGDDLAQYYTMRSGQDSTAETATIQETVEAAGAQSQAQAGSGQEG